MGVRADERDTQADGVRACRSIGRRGELYNGYSASSYISQQAGTRPLFTDTQSTGLQTRHHTQTAVLQLCHA
jgi:hypothetical protein